MSCLDWVSPPKNKTKSRRNRRGTSLIEVTVSTLLVAILMVTALRATAVIHGSTIGIDQQAAWQLAADTLVEELRGLNYEEPGVSDGFGIDAGESSSDRSTWDDCDDANGYATNQLTTRDGLAFGTLGMQASISVAYVSPTSLGISYAETQLKQATVRVGDGSERDIVVRAILSQRPESDSPFLDAVEARLTFVDDSQLTFSATSRNSVQAP